MAISPRHTKAALWAVLTLSALAVSSASGALLYSESFDTPGTIADYTGVGEIFSAHVALGAGSGTVAGGELNVSMLGQTPDQADNLYAHIDLGADTPLLSVQMDFTGVQYNAANGAFQLYAGAFDEIGDFNPSVIPSGDNRSWAKINVRAGNPYTVNAFGSGPGAEPDATTTGTIGQKYTWSMYFNNSGSAETYLAPDGTERTLDIASFSFFVDGVLIGENIAKGDGGYASGALEGLIINLGRNYDNDDGNGNTSSNLDNIIIRDDLALIPEPGSAALLGIGGLLFLARRRRTAS